jgi:hypothetical protein
MHLFSSSDYSNLMLKYEKEGELIRRERRESEKSVNLAK